MAYFKLLLSLAFLFEIVVAKRLRVSLVNDGPAVRGSNVTFTATVTGYDVSEKLKFVFWDDAQPQDEHEFYRSSNSTAWTVEYSRDLYEAGEYTIKVNLMRQSYANIFWYVVDTAATTFNLTDTLNGNFILSQNNSRRPNNFVAVNKTVQHLVQLPEKELQFLIQNSSSVVTYWFIDCIYIDQTIDFALNYTYSDVMNSHYVDALVVANHQPLPPLPTTTTPKPTTTTTKPTTTTPKPTTTTPKPTTTTPKPTTTTKPTKTTHELTTTLKPSTTTKKNVTNSTDVVHNLVKRAISNKTNKKKTARSPLEGFICSSSVVPMGESYTYGHYQETIGVREPIGSPVNITGLNWLQHGDLMKLDVKYSGSPPFNFCAEYKFGQYNITGNETCEMRTPTVNNMFPLVHYFPDSDQHTVLVIIENDIGKVVARATINIYKASVHAQLSVIVVPVVFCLLAVILVVFGVAYYQHRSRYTIEVADFDFGQQAHFDYKTFTERLRDSFRNAFNFGDRDDTDALTANTRYDSMT